MSPQYDHLKCFHQCFHQPPLKKFHLRGSEVLKYVLGKEGICSGHLHFDQMTNQNLHFDQLTNQESVFRLSKLSDTSSGSILGRDKLDWVDSDGLLLARICNIKTLTDLRVSQQSLPVLCSG